MVLHRSVCPLGANCDSIFATVEVSLVNDLSRSMEDSTFTSVTEVSLVNDLSRSDSTFTSVEVSLVNDLSRSMELIQHLPQWKFPW